MRASRILPVWRPCEPNLNDDNNNDNDKLMDVLKEQGRRTKIRLLLNPKYNLYRNIKFWTICF
jgi:hypothetical protein